MILDNLKDIVLWFFTGRSVTTAKGGVTNLLMLLQALVGLALGQSAPNASAYNNASSTINATSTGQSTMRHSHEHEG